MDYPSTPSTPSDSDSDISNHPRSYQLPDSTRDNNSQEQDGKKQNGYHVSGVTAPLHSDSTPIADSSSSSVAPNSNNSRRVRRRIELASATDTGLNDTYDSNTANGNKQQQHEQTQMDAQLKRKAHKQHNGSNVDNATTLNQAQTTNSMQDEVSKPILGNTHKYSVVSQSHSTAPMLTSVSSVDASINALPPTTTLPLSSTFMSHQFSSSSHSSAVPYTMNPLAFHHPAAAPFPMIITHPVTNATSYAAPSTLQQIAQTGAALPPLVSPTSIPPSLAPSTSKRGARRTSNPPLKNEIHPNFSDILHQAVEDHRKEQQTAEARKKEHERVERETGLIAKSVLSYHVLNQLVATENQLHHAALVASMTVPSEAQTSHTSPSKTGDASSSGVVLSPSMPPLETGVHVHIKPDPDQPSQPTATTSGTQQDTSDATPPAVPTSASTPATMHGNSSLKTRSERKIVHPADYPSEADDDADDLLDDGDNENSPSSGSNDDSADSDYSASSNRQAARPCPLINHLMREPICTLEMQLHKKIFTPQQIKFLKLNQPQHLVPAKPFNTVNSDKDTSEEDLLTISIRIMGTFPPKETYFVAKDVCPMVRTNVAKTIQKYDDTEKARVPVLCMRANGTVSTHVLSVLTTKGLRKLLNSSRTPLAPQLLKRILAHMDELHEAGHQAYDQHMKRKQQLEDAEAKTEPKTEKKQPRSDGRTKLTKAQRVAQSLFGESSPVKVAPPEGSTPITGEEGDERYFAIRRRVLDEQLQQHQQMVELEKRRYIEWQQYVQHMQNIQEVQKMQNAATYPPLAAPSPFATSYSHAYSTMPEYAAYVAANQTAAAYPTPRSSSSISMSAPTPPSSFPLSTITSAASSSAAAYPPSPYLYYPTQPSMPPTTSQSYNMQYTNNSVYPPAVYPQAYYSTPPVPTIPPTSYPYAY